MVLHFQRSYHAPSLHLKRVQTPVIHLASPGQRFAALSFRKLIALKVHCTAASLGNSASEIEEAFAQAAQALVRTNMGQGCRQRHRRLLKLMRAEIHSSGITIQNWSHAKLVQQWWQSWAYITESMLPWTLRGKPVSATAEVLRWEGILEDLDAVQPYHPTDVVLLSNPETFQANWESDIERHMDETLWRVSNAILADEGVMLHQIKRLMTNGPRPNAWTTRFGTVEICPSGTGLGSIMQMISAFESEGGRIKFGVLYTDQALWLLKWEPATATEQARLFISQQVAISDPSQRPVACLVKLARLAKQDYLDSHSEDAQKQAVQDFQRSAQRAAQDPERQDFLSGDLIYRDHPWHELDESSSQPGTAQGLSRDRILKEYQILQGPLRPLQGSVVPEVYGCGSSFGQQVPFFVMQLLQSGGTIAVGYEERLGLLRAAAAIHAAGVLHGDLTPDAVMRLPGSCDLRIMDFSSVSLDPAPRECANELRCFAKLLGLSEQDVQRIIGPDQHEGPKFSPPS
ncbi:hypothetical protein WJX73_006179 [Symbiochloris irregularis]|uniref:Uncharacterized protein n=1 Tax=Symbiochloris irregularis TaxID=706552 RepID=A0AAW1PET3_9CHLO